MSMNHETEIPRERWKGKSTVEEIRLNFDQQVERFSNLQTGQQTMVDSPLMLAQIDKEDSPRSLSFQLELLRTAGFSNFDVVHRNSVFGCYMAIG